MQDTYWHILRKELEISGTWNSSFNDTQNDWKESLETMADGAIDVKPLITHKFSLSRCNEAFEIMIKNPENKLKWFDFGENDNVSVHYESTPHIHRTLTTKKLK